jgi:hypothetical protein
MPEPSIDFGRSFIFGSQSSIRSLVLHGSPGGYLVGEVRNDYRIYLGVSPRGMFSKDMTSISCAPFAITQRRLAVRADDLGSLRELHRVEKSAAVLNLSGTHGGSLLRCAGV